jgi:hypothetical protein
MTTVAVYAAQMKGQGVSDDDIVQQLRQQTGKHKPGPNDEVPGTPPSQPLPQGNGQPEGLGMAAPTPQGLLDSQFQQDVGNVPPQGNAQIMSPGYNNQGPQFNPMGMAQAQQPQGRPPTPTQPDQQFSPNSFPNYSTILTAWLYCRVACQ